MKPKKKFDHSLIEETLANFSPLELDSSELIKSAVLIPIKPTDSGYNIIVTERSSRLKHHRGEMSFPGGRFDTKIDKSLQDTALRETFEEIGIKQNEVNIIGRLDDLPTLTGFLIRPYVGLLRNNNEIKFRLNYKEVSELIEIPIEYLGQNNLFYEISFPKDPENCTMLCFNYEDPPTSHKFKIWGATAHMLQEFLKKLYNIIVITPEYHRPILEECHEFVKKKLNK